MRNSRAVYDGPPEGGRYPSVEQVQALAQEQPTKTWADYFGDPIEPRPLTYRQKEILRAYYTSGCRGNRAAQALGISRCRVYEVKGLPGAHAYLDDLEERTIDAVCQARAAQLLAPTLKP